MNHECFANISGQINLRPKNFFLFFLDLIFFAFDQTEIFQTAFANPHRLFIQSKLLILIIVKYFFSRDEAIFFFVYFVGKSMNRMQSYDCVYSLIELSGHFHGSLTGTVLATHIDDPSVIFQRILQNRFGGFLEPIEIYMRVSVDKHNYYILKTYSN